MLWLGLPASAQDKGSDEYQRCLDKAVTNPEFAQCSGNEIKRQESLLNTAWAKASAAMKEWDAKAHADLLTEQRAWVVYKDASCTYFDNREAFGREGEVMHFGSCRVDVLKQRVKKLNDLMRRFLTPK